MVQVTCRNEAITALSIVELAHGCIHPLDPLKELYLPLLPGPQATSIRNPLLGGSILKTKLAVSAESLFPFPRFRIAPYLPVRLKAQRVPLIGRLRSPQCS